MANSAFTHEPSFNIPGSTTDNAVIRWDGTSGGGQLNSGIIIDDSNVITGITSLQVDNLNLNGNTLSSTAGTDLLITPLGGQQLILDGTIIIDAGVVTGATSITATEFVGGGSALTALNGTQVTSGTLPAARIADDSIVEAKLDVSNSPTDDYFLQAQSGEGGGLTWAAAGVTVPLVLDQLTADTGILSLRSTADVVHSASGTHVTGANTNTYGMFKKSSATSGGMEVIGISETGTGTGLVLHGSAGQANQSTDGTATGAIIIRASEHGGDGSWQSFPDASNLLTVERPNNSGSPTTRFIVTGYGHVILPAGNLVIGAAGKGIDFSATANSSGTMANELLDDYEEGAWTPLAFDDSNNDSESQTYDTPTAGSYTKIGNRVFIQGHLVMTSIGSLTASQRLKIGGLPFATSSSAPQATISVGFAGGLNITAGQVVAGYIGVGDVRILMRLWDATAGQTNFTVGELSSNGDIRFFGQYHV